MKTLQEILKTAQVENLSIYIPAYQRGYRWTEEEVSQLIRDIQDSKEKNYFLQLLVVRRDGNNLRIIDGQQRLTTCLLILEEAKRRNVVGVPTIPALVYERRGEGGGSLDRHYQGRARKCIESLLGEDVDVFGTVVQRLLDCHFLDFNVSAHDAELDFFSRINTWKISATDSELVKCLLLSKDDAETVEAVGNRAIEWNMIERWLSSDDVWGFIAGAGSTCEDRMGQLLFYTGIPNETLSKNPTDNVRKFPLYDAFGSMLQNATKSDLWKRVLNVYELLNRWYSEKFDRHLVGWFLHRKGERLPSLIDENVKKCALEEAQKLSTDDDGWIDDPLIYENYQERKELHQYLLLANVAWCCIKGGVDYDFWRHSGIAAWTLEHVHARNQEKLGNVEFLNLKFLDGKDPQDLWEQYKELSKDDAQEFLANNLSLECGYPGQDEDHSLGNMALLPKDSNSSLNDKLFVGKQREILSWALKGRESYYWAPPLTVAMFVKEVGDANDKFLCYWSENDRKAYRKLIEKCIKNFLKHFNVGG